MERREEVQERGREREKEGSERGGRGESVYTMPAGVHTGRVAPDPMALVRCREGRGEFRDTVWGE